MWFFKYLKTRPSCDSLQLSLLTSSSCCERQLLPVQLQLLSSISSPSRRAQCAKNPSVRASLLWSISKQSISKQWVFSIFGGCAHQFGLPYLTSAAISKIYIRCLLWQYYLKCTYLSSQHYNVYLCNVLFVILDMAALLQTGSLHTRHEFTVGASQSLLVFCICIRVSSGNRWPHLQMYS